jgi:predicted transcriptional regulator of viral defense system
MALTSHQRAIIAEAKRNGGHITKAQAVALIGSAYYCNAENHVGSVLSRMVKAGMLERTNPGVFQVCGKRKPKGVTVYANTAPEIW